MAGYAGFLATSPS